MCRMHEFTPDSDGYCVYCGDPASRNHNLPLPHLNAAQWREELRYHKRIALGIAIESERLHGLNDPNTQKAYRHSDLLSQIMLIEGA
jgi:hypothetical protein